jgi:hypothetical protein
MKLQNSQETFSGVVANMLDLHHELAQEGQEFEVTNGAQQLVPVNALTLIDTDKVWSDGSRTRVRGFDMGFVDDSTYHASREFVQFLKLHDTHTMWVKWGHNPEYSVTYSAGLLRPAMIIAGLAVQDEAGNLKPLHA